MMKNNPGLMAVLAGMAEMFRPQYAQDRSPYAPIRRGSSPKKPARSARGFKKQMLRHKACAAHHLGITVKDLTPDQFTSYMNGRGRVLTERVAGH